MVEFYHFLFQDKNSTTFFSTSFFWRSEIFGLRLSSLLLGLGIQNNAETTGLEMQIPKHEFLVENRHLHRAKLKIFAPAAPQALQEL